MAKFSASDKNELKRRIKDRIKLITDSVSSNSIDEEGIREKMLADAGVVVPSSEYEAQHKDLLRQRDEMVEPYIEEEKNALQIRLGELSNDKQEELNAAKEEYNQAITRAKERLASQKREITDRYTATEKELKDELEVVRERVTAEKTQEITRELEELKRKQIEIASIERQMDLKFRTQIQVLRRHAGRIDQIITDSHNKILEDLLFMDQLEEGKKLLERIPNVAEVLELMNQPDGVQMLIHRMNPDSTRIFEAMNNGPARLGHSNNSEQDNQEDPATFSEASVVDNTEQDNEDPYQNVRLTNEDLAETE